jgi:hypothetical protein
MRLPILFIPFGLALFADGVARAADPTTADCLAASDASLKAGNQHKLRAERAQLLVCAAPSCPADIRRDCVSRVDEVNLQIPTTIFGAKDPAGSDLSAVKVTMDGEVLAERLEGTALSIDPGEHTFSFETAGQAPVTRRLLIQQAQKDRREVIQFGAPAPATAASVLPAEPPSEESRGLGSQRILAMVAGGIGVAGVGLGTGLGVLAASQKSTAQGACPGNPCATQDGANKWSTAAATGNISTIAFVVGGLGLAGAAALWLTVPRSSSTRVGFGPGNLLQMKGTW